MGLIINRALVREVLHTSVAVTLVMLTIFLVVRILGFLHQAAEGDIPVESVLILVALKLVGYLDVILPLMLYIAILMVLGRWHRDNEMTVLSACGVGLANFLKPLSFLVFLVAGVVAIFSFYLTPLSLTAGWSLEMEYRNRSEISGVVPGVFMETRKGKGVYFVERFDKEADRYENVFVYKSSFGREGVVVAQYAYQRMDDLTGDHFLVLKNGTRYEGNPGEPDYRVLDYESYALRIEPRNQIPAMAPVKARPTPEILRSDHPQLVGEWHWRIAKVLMVPILGLFALGFSYAGPRSGRVLNTLLAFLIYFIYTNLLGFSVALLKKGRLDPNTGLWWIHGVFLLLALFLFYRRAQNLSLLPHLRFRLRTG